MGASNSTSSNVKFYSLKAKTSNEETPHFALTEKVDGAWKTTGTFDTMAGRLKHAEIKEKEYNGSKFNVFVFTIEDDTEVSKVEMTHNSVTHNLINALATDCNTLDEYSFVLSKKQTKGNDNKMYWNGVVYVNVKGKDKGLMWSIDPKLAPKKEPVMVNGVQFVQNGKGVWDDSKLKAFWEDVFRNKIAAKLNLAVIGIGTHTPAPPVTNEQPPVVSNSQDDDSLPF